MMAFKIRNNNSGFILIFTLWVLGFLTLIVVHIGFGVRQKIALLKHLEDRAELQNQAEFGIKKSIAIISDAISQNPASYTLAAKQRLHNNPQEFQNVFLNNKNGVCNINYHDWENREFFGVIDEERKLNINRANPWTVKPLIEKVLGVDSAQALDLAEAIYKWRQPLSAQARDISFEKNNQDSAHVNSPKSEPYEHIDALLFVRGINKLVYDKLVPYLTVYTDGQVNINTASAEVLAALGLPAGLIEKILSVRRGKDLLDGTEDDFVFQRVFDVASDINQVVKLEPGEAQLLDQLNLQGWLTTQSFFYTIQSQAQLKNSQATETIEIVFNGREHWIECWKEK